MQSESVPRRRRFWLLVFGVFLPGLALILAITALVFTLMRPPAITEADLIAATHDGDRVVGAVQRFQEAEGTLPESLDSLVPKYISQIPRQPFGEWSLYPSEHGDPGRKGFSVILYLDQDRFRTKFERILCLVDPDPRRRPEWIASPKDRYDTSVYHLRYAAPGGAGTAASPGEPKADVPVPPGSQNLAASPG